MPSQRMSRNFFDDSKSEPASTKEKQLSHLTAAISKGRRRNGTLSNLKDATNVTQLAKWSQASQNSTTSIDWSSFDSSVLHAYCYVHRLDTPSSFISSYNQRTLTRPGIGQCSPTMARRRNRQKVGKDVLAMAVKKDFNAASAVESELIISFLYAVHNQDKDFRMRFEPTQPIV